MVRVAEGRSTAVTSGLEGPEDDQLGDDQEEGDA